MASKPTAKLVELCKELDLDDDTLRKYMKVFQEEIKLGLDASTVDRSSLKCYVTYVQDLPTGDERGKFLALDLGGTNFRVLLLKKSRRYFDVRAKTFRIPKDIMRATGEELVELLNELDLSNEVLAKYRDVFIDEIKLGLDNATVDKSSLKCYVTYVQDIPDENVRGKFLAIDLGGTNFRVLCIKLAKTYLDMRSKKYQIPESLMKKSGEQLFDHIADCLYGFTVEHKINQDNLPLGFTFSFPCEQRGLEVGILKQWTKGFSCPGVEGENVVQLLREAIKRKKDLVIDVVAVLNDTTGTLMSCAWKKTNTKVGLIIGTGTNICYVEKTKNVAKFDGDTSKPIVLINTESGAFGGGGQVDFVRTKWDVELDAESINPGVNIMEKMISGMYLGDFVRRVLLTAVERQFIFDGVATEKLKKMGTFESKYVSDIEEDLPGQHDNARKVLGYLGYGSPTEQDCVDLHYASFIAWQRAGRMVSASMAAILNHMQYDDVTIGVDGSLYRFHPGFADLMNKKIRELTDPHIKFKCILAEDGSGRGAALVAASVRKFKRPPGAGRPGSRGGRPSSGGGPDSKENRDSNGSAGLSPNHSVGPGDSLQKKPRRDGDGTDTERRRSRPSVAKDVSAPIDKKKDDDIDEKKDRHKDADDAKKNENDEENTMKEDTEKSEDIDDSDAPLKDARKPSTHEDEDDKFKEKHGKEEDKQNDGSQMGDDEKENDGKDGGKKESDKTEEDNKENDEGNRNDDHHIDGFHAFGFARKNIKDHEKEKDTDDDETNGKEEEASIDENDVAAVSKDKDDNRKTDKKEPRENTYELMKGEEKDGKERIDEKDAKPDDEGIRKGDKEQPRENTHELMKAEENDRKERIDEKDAKPDDEGIRKDDKEKPREKLDEEMGGKEKDEAQDGRAKVDEKDAKPDDEGIRKDDKEKPREKLDEEMGGKEKDEAQDGRAKVDEKDAKPDDEGIRKDDKEEPREKLDEEMGGKEKDEAEDGKAKVDEKDAKPDDEGIRKDDKEKPREKLDEGMGGKEKDEAEDGKAKVDEKDAKPDDEGIRKDDKEEPREKLDEGMGGKEKDEAEDGRAKVDEKDAKPDNEREDDDTKDRDDQNKNEDKIEVSDNKRKPCKSVQERMRMKEKENEEEGKDGKDGKYLKPDDENKDEKAVDKEDLEPNVSKDHEERDQNKGNKEDGKEKSENGERKDKTDDNDNTRLQPNEPMLDDPKGPHKDKTNDENNDEIRDEEKKKNMNDDKEKRAQEEEKENEKEKKEENEKEEERGKDGKEKE